MKQISKILSEYGNQTLSTVTGYPVNHIKMFRKNDIDHFAVKTDSTGRGIPTRGVMERRIIEKVNQYESKIKINRTTLTHFVSAQCDC